ncbi:MAG: signal peptide peptidase SppA [Geminocystis sp.]|nr:signal peptide peptidase SppA [Geminocystis sp.]MCS7147256.1 signal peptide peptidase SppA [Geminocystis sp.]MDW8116253.1 signal peptide peptidase SppA [Geminocystis sp.]MDW8462754.1 signal peptide peptidase SppA [Geminocystis sp.]
MKDFLKHTFASFIGTVSGLFFVVFTSGGALVLLTSYLSSIPPTIEDKSVLVFELKNTVRDYNNSSVFGEITGDNSIGLNDIIYAVNKAAEDPRIYALYIDGSKGNISTGYASISEIRKALEKFKKSGKKIIAYLNSAQESDYLLASVADEIVINPLGGIEINGLATSQLFFASALKRYGIGVQVIRAGKYKSAVEPFTMDKFSEENRSQTKEILSDIWVNLRRSVSKSRNLNESIIDDIANNKGILLSHEAEKIKLVDKVKYPDEVTEEIKQITNSKEEEDFPQITISDYVAAKSTTKAKNRIAILYLEGTIVDGRGKVGEVGSEDFVKEIRKIRQDDNIKGVVLRINSPGGSAPASDSIWRQLQLLAKEKPLVVSMGDVAASGGYWVATAGERIFADHNTITGSIGVFGLIFNFQNLARNNGINNDVIKTNDLADLNNSFSQKDERELAIFQKGVDRVYELFLQRVSQSRKMPVNRVIQIAEGRIWSGERAKEIGLVDELGGLEEAISYLSEKLQLNDNYQIVTYPESQHFIFDLLQNFGGIETISKREEITRNISGFCCWPGERSIRRIIADALSSDGFKIYSILPYELEIK